MPPLHRLLVFTLTLMMVEILPLLAFAATGLPLPRFVSLRASEVNVRTGPGVRYPVDWIFHRHGLPVEIVAEFDTWRKIRDSQGTEGWVHQSLLSGKRALIVTGETRRLFRKPDTAAAVTAMVEANVMGEILSCPAKSQWCRIGVGDFEGWMQRSDFWGTYPDEEVH